MKTEQQAVHTKQQNVKDDNVFCKNSNYNNYMGQMMGNEQVLSKCVEEMSKE